jgi:Co/Zn/Cd efflux system component
MLLERGSDRVSDLHLWRLGPGHLAAVVSIVTHDVRPPERYKKRLKGLPELSHVMIEVTQCPGVRHWSPLQIVQK